jgi:hypothetical protein
MPVRGTVLPFQSVISVDMRGANDDLMSGLKAAGQLADARMNSDHCAAAAHPLPHNFCKGFFRNEKQDHCLCAAMGSS